MKTHELKTDPEPFGLSFAGSKMFEIRKNDRGFRVGDLLILRETVHSNADMAELGKPLEYTGRSLSRIVNEVREGYGLRDGYCVLGCDKI